MIATMFRATHMLLLMLIAINGGGAGDTVPNVYIPGEILHVDECSLDEPLNVLPASWEYVTDHLDGEWLPLVQLPYHCHG